MNKFIGFITIITTLVSLSVKADDVVLEYTTPAGVQVKQHYDGRISLKSTAEADLLFGDRSDIREAVQSATRQAKANISKFLEEEVHSSEHEKMVMDTVSVQQSNSSPDVIREKVSQITNEIRVNSNAILRGVISLEEKVVPEEKYVSVTLGYSDKTQAMAEQIQNNMLGTNPNTQQSSSEIHPTAQENQKSHIRRSPMYDEF